MKKQRAELKKIFDELDVNKNGTIDVEEVIFKNLKQFDLAKILFTIFILSTLNIHLAIFR
mgnify:FL=1